MDKIDQKLLFLLANDSRTPLKALAAAVGLASSTVQERIKRLEKEGVIRRYTIDIRPQNTIEAYLLVTATSAGCADLAPKITKLPNVLKCQSISGDQDMLVHVQVPDLETLGSLRAELAEFEGVSSLTTHPVLKDWN